MGIHIIEVIEGGGMEVHGCNMKVVHGNDIYRVSGERGRYLNVYPERELPNHPGRKYPWPVGIPWLETAASHAVMLFRRDSGHI